MTKQYANSTLARIATLSKKLEELDKILKAGDYQAAGIEITISVGANSARDPFTIDLGMAADLDAILGAIKKGMIDTRAWYMRCADKDLAELKTFLEQFGPANPSQG